ncbi:BrnT family toxin [Treponema sp. OMZ 791]|uniref:BrnT family toxin n=1 Tax=Treponema sp. OMZ 791 TaxID=2563666 RepID=UPI0020A520C4|nr:BrnT family toxin [Treponema sp. OMZ 791]UTC73319.1 BrnT family toxin [Treponema sp. OMZ 791]
MTFEWDENKNSENIRKHQVSFEKRRILFDANRMILEDIKHSSSEKRYFCIGKTDEGILTVRFTIRGQNIRIFGAGYWRQGKKLYEEHLQ